MGRGKVALVHSLREKRTRLVSSGRHSCPSGVNQIGWFTPVPDPAAGLQRWAELPTSMEIKGEAASFRKLLQKCTIPERKALIPNFVADFDIVEDEPVLA